MYLGSFTELPNEKRVADVALFDANGVQLSGFDPSRPANATLTQPTVNTTSSVIAAANPARRGLIVHNTSGRRIFVAFAATASAAAYTYDVANGNQFEIPLNGYTGVVSVVTNAGSGTICVTEVTA
jgi:hypothetical protein